MSFLFRKDEMITTLMKTHHPHEKPAPPQSSAFLRRPSFLQRRESNPIRRHLSGFQIKAGITMLKAGFLFTHMAYSTTPSPILIRSPKTNIIEFSAYAKTEPVKTYAQHQLDINRKTPRPVNLQSLLKQAQMDFLSHEPNESKKTFRLITEHIHSFDWNTEERKIIFYSLFRLAQLEKNTQKQKLLLQEAFVFGMNLKLDLQLFPPPLVEHYLKIKKTTVFVSLKLKNLFPLHEIILINGKIYSYKETVTLPYGVYRITAFSSSNKSWTQTLSLSRLISKKIHTPSLTKGSCHQPVLNNLDQFSQKNHIRILFPNFCVWSSRQNPLATKQADTLPADIKMSEEELKEPEKNNHWWEEEWVWLGAAVVLGITTVFILSESDNKKEERKQTKPIVKIGF
jgi:hypothetical protein